MGKTKTCSVCKISKSLHEFFRQPSGKYGRHCYCKKCYTEKYPPRKRNISPERRRDQNYRSRYGLTSEQINEMIAAQGGKCAVCNKLLRHPRVDHSHVTGKIRGILCGFCNPAISILENPEIRNRAIIYVERGN